MVLRSLALAAGALALLGASVEDGRASQLLDRNARDVTLRVSPNGAALITYRARGSVRRLLAWGGLNAVAPTAGRKQVAFRLDYSGGFARRARRVAARFGGHCLPYDGPPLAWLVTACKASDGSYWALQSWQRGLPNYGLPPTGTAAPWELRLSHWQGDLPALTVSTDWAYSGRFDHMYGMLRYGTQPVYGFRNTPRGSPLDTFGRNVYVDTLNSAYGPGWQRENGFLTHRPTGIFCYGFYPFRPGLTGRGQAYRATVIGPGVTPDVSWEGEAPGIYDRDRDRDRNAEQSGLFAGSKKCRAT